MDYSQFLYMKEELSLVAVILIIFLADLFMNPDKRNNMNNARFATILPIVLMVIHTIINLVPAAGSAEVSVRPDADHHQSRAQYRYNHHIFHGCRMAEVRRYFNQTR